MPLINTIGNIIGSSSSSVVSADSRLLVADLTHTLTPTKGSLTSFARASTITVDDFEDVSHTAIEEEAAFVGARRIENKVVTVAGADPAVLSEVFTATSGCTIDDAETITISSSGTRYVHQTGATGPYPAPGASDVIVISCDIQFLDNTGSGATEHLVRAQVEEIGIGVTSASAKNCYMDAYDRFTFTISGFTGGGASGSKFRIAFVSATANDKFKVTNVQYQLKTGSTDTDADEFTDDLAYGANVNGVQYKTTSEHSYVNSHKGQVSEGDLKFHFVRSYGDSLTADNGVLESLRIDAGLKRGHMGQTYNASTPLDTLNHATGGLGFAKANQDDPETDDSVQKRYEDTRSLFRTITWIQGGLYNEYNNNSDEAAIETKKAAVQTAREAMVADALSYGDIVILANHNPSGGSTLYDSAKVQAALVDDNAHIDQLVADNDNVYLFDQYSALEDPSNPGEINPTYNVGIGDGYHHNPDGDDALAAAVLADSTLIAVIESRPSKAPTPANIAAATLRGLSCADGEDVRYAPSVAGDLFKALDKITASMTYEPLGTPTFGNTDTLMRIVSGTSPTSKELFLFYDNANSRFTFRKTINANNFDATANATPTEGTQYALEGVINDSSPGVSLEVNGSGNLTSPNTTVVDLSSATYISIGSTDGSTDCQGTIKSVVIQP